jgi:hypothetical protein
MRIPERIRIVLPGPHVFCPDIFPDNTACFRIYARRCNLFHNGSACTGWRPEAAEIDPGGKKMNGKGGKFAIGALGMGAALFLTAAVSFAHGGRHGRGGDGEDFPGCTAGGCWTGWTRRRSRRRRSGRFSEDTARRRSPRYRSVTDRTAGISARPM